MRRQSVRHLIAAVLVTTSVCAVAAPAQAQDASKAKDTTKSQSANNSSQGLSSGDENSIIVTARRRDETLQTTPVAVTAINTAALKSSGATNIGGLQGDAPGLLITQQNSGAQAANLSIRGLTYADISKSQTPTVGVVVDGVTIGTNTGQLQNTFDVASIEVLRGPQGTLFGANTIGGVIIIKRSKPTMRTGVKAEASYSRWNTWDARGLINLGNNKNFGVKAWYSHSQTDGYYYNTLTNSRTGGSKNDSYGAAFLFQPVDSSFDAEFEIENVVQSFTPVNVNISSPSDAFYPYIPVPANLYQVAEPPTYSHYHAPDATLNMHLTVGPVKLTSITGWRHSRESQTQDFGTNGIYYVLRKQHYTQWSQEFRASGNITKSLDYVAGLYFFDSRYSLEQWTSLFLGSALYNASDPSAVAPGQQLVHGSTTSYAGYADFDWSFLPKWRLELGGRWSHDNKKLSNGYYNVVNGANAGFGLLADGNANFENFSPKVGIDFRPNPQTMLYANWSRGYRSGGFSPRAATPQTASIPFQPETVDAYEVGAKLDLLDHKLQMNFAGYISNYKNMQQNLTLPGGPTGNQTLTGNVPGGALIKGIEFDGAVRPIKHLKITATASVIDSHFRNYVVGGVSPVNGAIIPFDYSQNDLIYAPKFSGSVHAQYIVPTHFGDVIANIGLRHISPYDEQISLGPLSGNLTTGPVIVNGNDPAVRTKTQNLLDASLKANFTIGSADAFVTVFGRNLLDNHTTTAAFTVAGLWNFASALEPRTYGVTVGIQY